MSAPAPVELVVTSERGPYRVHIGAGLAEDLPRLFDTLSLGARRVVVSSAPVWRKQGNRLRPFLAGDRPTLIPDGERAKSLMTVSKIYDACVRHRLDRSSAIVAFGGGVVGDVAGFAAASYLRGITLVQVPTTLLAQVDSAIGGKVGVNLTVGKNLVGAFHAPALVLCDPTLLRTLPRREFRAGLYEVIKYGVIASRSLFDRVAARLPAIFAHDLAVLTPVIADCCRIKADVVTADEREQGPRRALNFGHTIGHALEAITKYRRFLHGEAIGYGMLAAARLSVMRGAMSVDDAQRFQSLVAALGKRPAVRDLRVADAMTVVGRDKKVVAGRLHFVLARGIGATEIVSNVTTDELAIAMRSIGLR